MEITIAGVPVSGVPARKVKDLLREAVRRGRADGVPGLVGELLNRGENRLLAIALTGAAGDASGARHPSTWRMSAMTDDGLVEALAYLAHRARLGGLLAERILREMIARGLGGSIAGAVAGARRPEAVAAEAARRGEEP